MSDSRGVSTVTLLFLVAALVLVALVVIRAVEPVNHLPGPEIGWA